jgi:putative transposase
MTRISDCNGAVRTSRDRSLPRRPDDQDPRTGRPSLPTARADRYRGRNVVERGCNRTKNWRALATRPDKHVLIYRGGVVLALILLWLTSGETRPP